MVATVDEFYSPYCYVGNNPIKRIDEDGNQTGWIQNPGSALKMMIEQHPIMKYLKFWNDHPKDAAGLQAVGNAYACREMAGFTLNISAVTLGIVDPELSTYLNLTAAEFQLSASINTAIAASLGYAEWGDFGIDMTKFLLISTFTYIFDVKKPYIGNTFLKLGRSGSTTHAGP